MHKHDSTPARPRRRTAPTQAGKYQPGSHLALLLVLGLCSPLAIFLLACNEVARANQPVVNVQQLTPTQSIPTSTATPTSTPTPTPTPTPTLFSSQILARIHTLLQQQVRSQQFSGSVLIAQGSQAVLDQGYSLANWSTRTPNAPDTRFYLGSVTKEFTAMAVLILQQQGKLSISRSICSYITPCPSPWRAVTLKELLTHTSGIPELDDAQLSGASPAAWIASFDSAPLEFTPGSAFDYCSICYQILGYVVQRVSALPYSQFVEEKILKPLHMTASGFDPDTYYATSKAATGYASWQSSAERLGWEPDTPWSFLNASGLLYSTVEDLNRWDQALSSGTLLSQAALTQAFKPYVTATLFPGSQYGYGWFISQSPVKGHTLIWHDGVIDGFRAFNGRYIDDNVTIVILSNLATTDVVALQHTLENIIFGRISSN